MKYYTSKTKRNDIHRNMLYDSYCGMYVKLIDNFGVEYIGQFNYDKNCHKYCLTKFIKNPEHCDIIVLAKSNIKHIEKY